MKEKTSSAALQNASFQLKMSKRRLKSSSAKSRGMVLGPKSLLSDTVKQSKTTAKSGKLAPTEHQIQRAYFDLVRLHMPNTKLIYAVPNGAHKSMAQRVKFQREGLTPGVPDVSIDFARGGYHGMRIEFKRNSYLHPSVEQQKALDQLNEAGYFARVHCDAERAWQETQVYLSLPT